MWVSMFIRDDASDMAGSAIPGLEVAGFRERSGLVFTSAEVACERCVNQPL